MRRFGITAVFPGKNLSKACKYHKKYPYLLRNKVIRYPNQVWSTDITYIKLPTGNVYLMAIVLPKVNLDFFIKANKVV